MDLSILLKKIEQLRGYSPENPEWAIPIPENPEFHDFRELTITDAPEWQGSTETVEEAHELLPQVIREYLQDPFPTYMLLVKALPGTGKTTAAVAVVDEAAQAGKRIMYAGPRHDFFKEVVSKSKNPSDWYEWLPRQEEDPDSGKRETCRYTPQISGWMTKGYNAMDFCSSVCGWDYVGTGCPYHAQKKVTQKIIYGQHLHTVLGHPLTFDFVIGDESPIGAFLNHWIIPKENILPHGMDMTEPFAEMLYALTMFTDSVSRLEGPRLLQEMALQNDPISGANKILEAISTFTVPLDALVQAPDIHEADQAASADYFYLPKFIGLLRRECKAAAEGKEFPHRIVLMKDGLHLFLRRSASENLPPHIVWLDATGNQRLYENVFGRPVHVVDIQPPIQGKIFQVVDRSNGKSSLMQKDKTLTSRGEQLALTVRAIQEGRKYSRPAVISFKDFVSQADLSGIPASHFYASRGTNEFESCDALIIAGTPQPSPASIVETAKMIFFERDEPFRLAWSDLSQNYRFIDSLGRGRSYPVGGYWSDPDLQELVSTMREDEIIQAAHRSRPVNHETDIWLLLNAPISQLPPDELWTVNQIFNVPPGFGLDPYLWARFLEFAKAREFITQDDAKDILKSPATRTKYFQALVALGWKIAYKNPDGDPSHKKYAIHP